MFTIYPKSTEIWIVQYGNKGLWKHIQYGIVDSEILKNSSCLTIYPKLLSYGGWLRNPKHQLIDGKHP